MQPKLTLLSDEIIARILEEAYELLRCPGVKVQNPEARDLLAAAGAIMYPDNNVVGIPEALVKKALESVPREFYLYDYDGNPTVHYGGDSVHFDPGSSGITMLNPETLEHDTTETEHLIRLLKVAEQLPQYDAQSTAVICHDVPKEIQDSYRLYLTLLYSKKPIVTGAFTNKTVQEMIDMLVLFAGSEEAARAKPRAIFDVCPAPPLIWSNFGAGNLIALARAGVPAEIVSVPLSGAAAPVTMLGTVTQHTAECFAGIVIHQLAHPGSPIVWGGAAAIFDMRKGATPMGAVETAMLDCSYAQVAKTLGMPTHTYLGATDSKLVDAQAGLESGISAMVGALSGINMISGSGMLDFLACHSAEKLVLDAEGIAMAKRMIGGVKLHTDTLATGFYDDKINFKGGDFLKQKATMQLFQKEQHLPSSVIDRDSTRAWKAAGSLDAFGRCKLRVIELLASYRRPEIDPEKENRLHAFILDLAKKCGLEELPKLEDFQPV
ncbi:MAG: trimethylamine methyltransferase family protein [Anaerolineales bacterium]|uniref:trimethylamine methyltransferase family protein n=1 Tax=Candidatus Villigracilis affinis TaxID=3140682 RepID=UPI001B4B2D7F|nr:trimethylamine methyltransferase family protein [Anaerolineales bacterium]MBK9601824.1 trimethylamine methyltransferase family protein [Anaerolineales bacterium]MBP8047658.1 trimethylamine methyltransferase family protein [Anaerolineales bacterium]